MILRVHFAEPRESRLEGVRGKDEAGNERRGKRRRGRIPCRRVGPLGQRRGERWVPSRLNPSETKLNRIGRSDWSGRFDLRAQKIGEGLAKSLEESGVDGGEVAGVNTGGTDGGKKIGIVSPAWDDMDVKMFRHAGAGGGA